MTPLDQVIQHIRAQGRVGTHGAVLLREIERLREALRINLTHYLPGAYMVEINALMEGNGTDEVWVVRRNQRRVEEMAKGRREAVIEMHRISQELGLE